MLFALTNFLRLCGIFKYESTRFWSPFIVQTLTNIFVISSIGYIYIGSVIYSLKYHNVIEYIKTAGYSHNNVLTILITYVYLFKTRSSLQCLIEAWDHTIENSFVVNPFDIYKTNQLLNYLFSFFFIQE